MTADLVRLEHPAAAVAVITVHRPEARNALTVSMKRRLIELSQVAALDPAVRVVAFRGAGGKAFMSGADIAEMAALDSVDDFVEQARLVDDLYAAIESIPQPTVAIIDGFAVGSGLMVALACDLRLCAPAARFGVPAAATTGNCLSAGEYSRLLATLGMARAKDLLLTGRMLTSEEALSWGLVSEIVPADTIDVRVGEFLATVAQSAPLATVAAKESLSRIARDPNDPLDDVLRRVLGSADFQEGCQAFVEKRRPIWRNA